MTPVQLREGNFERECVEEVCSTEEFHEVYDDFFASTKKLSKFQKCVKANPHSDTRTRASKNYLRECFYREDINKTGFQTDSTKPRCDWLMLSESFSHWLRAPSSQNQSENPPKSFCQGKPNGNYADPNNPKGFIQCHQNGQTTFTQCGTGLVYDKNNGICNWS